MAIEAPPGKLIRLVRVVTEVPWLPTGRGGRPMHPSFIIRMALDGKVANGRRLRLRTMKVGGALCTTEQWLLEFFTNTGTEDPIRPTPSPVPNRCGAPTGAKPAVAAV